MDRVDFHDNLLRSICDKANLQKVRRQKVLSQTRMVELHLVSCLSLHKIISQLCKDFIYGLEFLVFRWGILLLFAKSVPSSFEDAVGNASLSKPHAAICCS